MSRHVTVGDVMTNARRRVCNAWYVLIVLCPEKSRWTVRSAGIADRYSVEIDICIYIQYFEPKLDLGVGVGHDFET